MQSDIEDFTAARLEPSRCSASAGAFVGARPSLTGSTRRSCPSPVRRPAARTVRPAVRTHAVVVRPAVWTHAVVVRPAVWTHAVCGASGSLGRTRLWCVRQFGRTRLWRARRLGLAPERQVRCRHGHYAHAPGRGQDGDHRRSLDGAQSHRQARRVRHPPAEHGSHVRHQGRAAGGGLSQVAPMEEITCT